MDVLLRRIGQIISKEDFVQDIDPDNMELNSSAIEVYIHRLRKKVSADVLPIRNIKRCGYFLPRYEDLSDGSLCQAALAKPVAPSVWPRYELVGNHLAV